MFAARWTKGLEFVSHKEMQELKASKAIQIRE